MSKTTLNILGFVILAAMIAVTSWASLHENVFAGGAKIIREPWGIATLFDTYFAFFFFTLWVWYKERSFTARGFWTVFIVGFGNIAMAIYFLREIKRTADKGTFTVEKLLTLKQ